MAEDYISQFPEKVEVRVIKKLSNGISLTESHNLGALSKVDEMILRKDRFYN